MQLKQLSVFLENRTGRLAEVTRTLGDAGVNIRALSVADTSDFGILRLLVDKPKDAVEALNSVGLTVRLTEVVAVEIVDRPGGLATVLSLLQGSSINVEYMYAFMERHRENAILVFRFENPQKAITILQEANIKVFAAEELVEM
ncbi:MAG TPA: ACT domain-containing protein [Candidatus Sumerlaeota bacterium]|nr:ACT domain-containing protein [Candidatus Sumerlaeota bacterium]HPS00697.1 ACT domain-containing protein [Candidatus Sumerlaeota bacterium]